MTTKLTQKEKILKLLQDNPAGINSFGLARDLALQLPTRIFELRKDHNIISIDKQDGSVDYILSEGTPETTQPKFVVENGVYKAII